MKRNRTPSLSGTSTGENNNTSIVNKKKQKVLFTPCRRVGLTRKSLKSANNSLLNASQTNTTTTKDTAKRKSIVLDEKLSVFDFKDSPRNSPQDPTYTSKQRDDVTPSNVVDMEICSIINEPNATDTPKMKSKRGISHKITEPVQHSIDQDTALNLNLSPKVLLCKLDLNKIKISSPYTISDSEESEISKSPTKIHPQHKKSIKEKIEFSTKTSEDVEPQISQTGANIQFNKLSKRKNKAVLKSQTNVLTSKPQESSDKIDDAKINQITANETDNSHNNRVSSNLVDDTLNVAPITKTRKNKHYSCLKKKKPIPSNSQDDKIELNSSQLISLNENVKTSKIESDTIKETTKSQNTISDSESDSNEPLIRLKYPKRANLKSTKITTESLEKHDTSAILKSKTLRSSTFRDSLTETKEFDTNLQNSTSSKHKKSTKITSSETQEIESLKHDKSTKVTAELDNLGWEKHETRPIVKSKGSRKLYSDSPQFLEKELPISLEPEKFGWEKHESTPISTCEKVKELYVTLTPIPALETQKSSATSPESKNSALDKQENPPTKSKKDIISQSLDSDKETKLDCGTSKHKKSTKYTDEGHDSIWEKYKTEAKRRQEKDASHKKSIKPVENTGWEKHETPVDIKPKKITKLAFPSEDWNKELQELDMHIQTKINSNLKRKTPKLSSELQESNLVTEVKELVTDLQSKKDLTNTKHKKTKTVSESQDSTKVSDTIKPKASAEIDVSKVQKDTDKVSETIKPKASTEIAPPKVQEGEVVKNMLSVVNLANLKDIDYIKRVAESEGSVLEQQKSSTSKLASVESDESVKKVEVSTNQDLKSIESKLRAGIRESIKEAQNVYKTSIEIQGSPGIVPDLSLKSSKDLETKESNKLTPSQHYSNESQSLDIYLQPNTSQNSDLNDLRPNELHNSGLISFKHKKSTTLFPSSDSQNSINDLLELDVNLQVLKSQPNRILSDDESITSELHFVQTKEPPKLKSCLSKKSKFTTAIQEIKETNSYQQQKSRSLKLNSQWQNSNFNASEYSQSPDVFGSESSQHTEKRKNRRSTCSKHKKHISKPSTSNKIDYPEKSTPSFDYSDSEDDFREKKILGRRRKSSSSLKTDDRVKGKKLIKPIVDELNKTEHIRIRENISYTIIHKGNVISYVKSHDNDVDMKTTESDDNQQAPVLIKMCTKSTESRKSMIIERRNYTSTNTSLSVSDKENSDTENEISIIRNDLLDTKNEDKKQEPEKKRKINSENKLFGTNKLLEEKKATYEAVKHNRKNIISENKPAQESRVMEQSQESVVENENKKTENEKTTLRNELLEARVTNKKQETVVEKSTNSEIENNEKEKSIIRTELIGTRKLTLPAQEPVTEKKIQTSIHTENKEIEQEKSIIRKELLGAKKKIQTKLNSDKIDQENVAIRNELLEVRKNCKKLELYTERIQIEQEKLYIRNELIENRKKDKRRMSEKIRKHKASQQVKDPSIIKTTQTVKSASTSSVIDNSTTENMMTVEQIKKEIKATESRLKVRQEQLDRLNRLQNYKKAHDLKELRKVTLQIKSGCREALIDLLLVLKEHSSAQFDMGTLLHNMKISNDLVGYNEEEDCFV